MESETTKIEVQGNNNLGDERIREEQKIERRTQVLLKTIAYNEKLIRQRNQNSPFHIDKNTRTIQGLLFLIHIYFLKKKRKKKKKRKEN